MPKIDHVVVLMLENRSFDCILGRLYPGRKDFDGVPTGAFNMVGDVKVPAWTSDPGDGTGDFTIPTPDRYPKILRGHDGANIRGG